MGRKSWRFGVLVALQKYKVDMQKFQWAFRTGRLAKDTTIMKKLFPPSENWSANKAYQLLADYMNYEYNQMKSVSKKELKAKGYIAKYQDTQAKQIIRILRKERFGKDAVKNVRIK